MSTVMTEDIGLTNEEMQKLVAVLSTQPNIEKAIVYGSRPREQPESSPTLT